MSVKFLRDATEIAGSLSSRITSVMAEGDNPPPVEVEQLVQLNQVAPGSRLKGGEVFDRGGKCGHGGPVFIDDQSLSSVVHFLKLLIQPDLDE